MVCRCLNLHFSQEEDSAYIHIWEPLVFPSLCSLPIEMIYFDM